MTRAQRSGFQSHSDWLNSVAKEVSDDVTAWGSCEQSVCCHMHVDATETALLSFIEADFPSVMTRLHGRALTHPSGLFWGRRRATSARGQWPQLRLAGTPNHYLSER